MRPGLLPFLLVLTFIQGAFGTDRLGYRAVDGVVSDGRVAFRAWTEGNRAYLLVVDPQTLETAVVSGDPGSQAGRQSSGDTALGRLRRAAEARRMGLQNAGIRRADPPRPGAWLTFDLCPTRKPLDRSVFTDLEKDGVPLPVLLEVSGLWIASHPRDFDWLVAERDAGRLAVTWVNHTENHDYVPGKPLDENFLLLPGTDLKAEIFTLENRLLDRGEVPSVFFRFPGLVSSPRLVDEVLALGLIPLGSSGWLAKQQNVKTGALVLTHANGNEPEGLELLETWDRGHRAEIAAGTWHWLGLEDLAEARIPPP